MTDGGTSDSIAQDQPARPGRARDVFWIFLRLGLTSFGGPTAHLGYFRQEFVIRRRWLGDQGYADLVALCQFLPGPASSQVGFAIGLMRAGWPGAIAAFLGFTLPSAMLLTAFALGQGLLSGPVWLGALHGLKIVAVAIIAQAVWGMARTLCPDRTRASIAVAAVGVLAFAPGALGMVGAIGLGAVAGLLLCRPDPVYGQGHLPRVPVSKTAALVAMSLFVALLVLSPLLAAGGPALAMFDSFYRAGALVFGGGHVILPLLQDSMVASGHVSAPQFLAGYGAAQSVPGPLFTFAAYLGALAAPGPHGIAGAGLALGAVFLPGFLILIAALPFWERLRQRRGSLALLQGANAAVVGILGAALYTPVFTGAIGNLRDLTLALVCLTGLAMWHLPPWTVVLVAACGGIALQHWP